MAFPHLCLLIDIPSKGHSIERDFFDVPNGVKTLLVISCKKQQTTNLMKFWTTEVISKLNCKEVLYCNLSSCLILS